MSEESPPEVVGRYVVPDSGMDCWIQGGSLPEWIPPRSRGRILYTHSGRTHFEVGIGGRQRTMLWLSIDCGRKFRTKSGEWIPESDPRAKRWLRQLVEDARAGGMKWKGFRGEDGSTMNPEVAEWVLQRAPLR